MENPVQSSMLKMRKIDAADRLSEHKQKQASQIDELEMSVCAPLISPGLLGGRGVRGSPKVTKSKLTF